ncbi:MAG: glycosyltransferase family 4 protein [Acidobacteriota bacterium]
MHVPRRFVRSDWGGTETAVLQMCRHVQAAGHQVEIACPRALADNDAEQIDGISVRRYPYFYPYVGLSDDARDKMDRKGGNLFSFQLMKALRREPDVDLLHLHAIKRLGGIGRHVARARGIPYVVSLHGGVHDVPTEEAASWVEPTKGALEWGKLLGWWVGSRRVLDDAAAILCNGPCERDATQAALPNQRVEYMPLGVELEHFRGGDSARFRAAHDLHPTRTTLLCLARIDVQKNQLLLIDAAAELVREGLDFQVVMVGPVTNDDYCQKVDRRIEELGLGEVLRRLPPLPAEGDHLRDAFAAADVFVLPSQHEPFGLVILEAWAAGRPVVASRVGGIPAFVTDETNGLLFTSGAKDELVERLRRLVVDTEARQALADAGRREAEARFTWEHATKQLLSVYEDVTRVRAA